MPAHTTGVPYSIRLFQVKIVLVFTNRHCCLSALHQTLKIKFFADHFLYVFPVIWLQHKTLSLIYMYSVSKWSSLLHSRILWYGTLLPHALVLYSNRFTESLGLGIKTTFRMCKTLSTFLSNSSYILHVHVQGVVNCLKFCDSQTEHDIKMKITCASISSTHRVTEGT